MIERGGHPGELLSALVDGELTVEDERSVVQHLATCPACRAERDQLAQLRQAVRDLPALDLPPPVWAQVIRAGRDDRKADHKADRTGDPKKARPAAWVGALSAAAAVVALFGLAINPTQHHRVTPQMAHLVQVHAASSGSEPVTGLAPAAVRASFAP